jgi:hypothetical protein
VEDFIPITTKSMVFCTLLRDMLQNGKAGARVIWPSAQWDSCDGTEIELFEMFRSHGSPAEIRFTRN